MKYSTLNEIPSSREMINTFRGYNHNLNISDGEFYDMKNLTSSFFPIMSPRIKRGYYRMTTDYSVTKEVESTEALTVTINNGKYLTKTNFAETSTIFEFKNGSWKVNNATVTMVQYGITVTGTKTAGDKITVTVASDATTHKLNGLIAKDALCYVDGTKLYINNYEVSGFTLLDSPKQLISMGAYIIIMPDKKYINTQDYTDSGSIDWTYTSSNTVTYELCRVDGTVYENVTVSSDEPGNPNNTDLWIDTSSTPHILKQYSSASATWVDIYTTYVKIKSNNIATGFKQYDAVTISGIDPTITQLKDLEGQTSVIWDAYHDTEGNGADDYIVVVGMLDTVCTQSSSLSVSREMPNMDFIIESGNRLWGCRYGTNKKNEIVNEIYASKLGDFKNWNCFMGLSTDSYIASCGTDGQFTGAITHLGYPLFFKENCLHKVYGTFPSNFQIQNTECRGVMKGAGKSLAIVNETLFYKSRNGVCAYDGSLPVEISSAMGDIHYSGLDTANTDALRNGAISGGQHNKYYISMKSEIDDNWYLFVYDMSTRTWHIEDNVKIDDFCACENELYFIDHDEQRIKTELGSGIKENTDIQWTAESGAIGLAMSDRKYVSNLNIRMSLDLGTRVRFYAQYDSNGEWEHLATITGTHLRSFSVPIIPKRCDHFKLRIVGTGDAKIFSITKTIVRGSDE